MKVMRPNTHILPDERTAEEIFGLHSASSVQSVIRFPIGLCHYVFEVRTSDRAASVVRISSPENRRLIQGGCYWSLVLGKIGVPIPTLYASGVYEDFAYMVLERLPGRDLGQVYGGLKPAAKRSIAAEVAEIQQRIATLPVARGYGFATSYEDANANGRKSWLDVVEDDIKRSEDRIIRAGHIEGGYVDRVRRFLAEHETYLRAVEPNPFLDDMTTKNVIVHEGALSGIVDTDHVCFGDPFFTVGLTRMALLSLDAETDYVDYWLDAVEATTAQRSIVQAYTLVFCFNFMSELGQTFNKEVSFSDERSARLAAIFESLATS
jgi:hypothetical protein